MTEQKRVAYNFKRLRMARGWGQDQLAAMGKVTQNYIAQVEGMHCNFGVRARKKWAKIFDVDVSEFLMAPRKSEKDHELASLMEEVSGYSAEEIKKIRETIRFHFGNKSLEARIDSAATEIESSLEKPMKASGAM